MEIGAENSEYNNAKNYEHNYLSPNCIIACMHYDMYSEIISVGATQHIDSTVLLKKFNLVGYSQLLPSHPYWL